MSNKKDTKIENLFAEFPPVATEEWKSVINEDLKGGDYEKKLVWKTTDGFKIEPFYRSENMKSIDWLLDTMPGDFPFIRGGKATSNDWHICQEIETPNIEKANNIIIDSISKGATAITVNALDIKSPGDLQTLFKDVKTIDGFINFYSSDSYINLCKFLEDSKLDCLKNSIITFDYDPISYALLHGYFASSSDDDMKVGAELVKSLKNLSPNSMALTVNGKNFLNSGSTLTQELGLSLASGNEYLNSLINNGVEIDVAAKSLIFSLAIEGNYFMEIAKLRAVRLLWAKIIEQYKPKHDDSMKMIIHSITASWNKTVFDPHVNMLRTTTEAMAAAIGGADMITVLPFDFYYKNSDDFSRRIARNQQIMLKEESSLNKVVDPSAGSYYIEELTSLIAEEAWKVFLNIENNGGMFNAIKSNIVQDIINESAKKRKDDIASRRTILLGTNQYPNTLENVLEKIETAEEDTLYDRELSREHQFKTIEIARGADDFEDLRLATESYESLENKCPTVFLFTYGNLAMRKARAGFSANFFGCAGYNIIDNLGFETIDKGVEDALKSKAEIVVICSSDEEYAEIVPPITEKIKKSNNNTIIIVAGYPKEILDELKKSGVDEFIHIKSNVLEVLTKLQQRIGVMI